MKYGPRVAIINSSLHDAESIEKKIKDFEYFNFDVKTFPTMGNFLESQKPNINTMEREDKFQLIFVQWDEDKKFWEKIREIYPEKEKTSIVITSLNKEVGQSDIMRAINQPNVVGWVNEEGLANKDIGSILYNLRREERIYNRLGIAMYGGGKFAQGILKLVNDAPWINRIDLLSESVSDCAPPYETTLSYEDIEKNTGLSNLFHEKKFATHADLKSWIRKIKSKRHDIVMFISGEHRNFSLPKGMDINEAQDILMRHYYRFNSPRVVEINCALNEIKFTGVEMILSNPIEPLSYIAAKISGNDERKIWSPTPDGIRYSEHLIARIEEPKKDYIILKAPIIGTHRKMVPYYEGLRLMKEKNILDANEAAKVCNLCDISSKSMLTKHLLEEGKKAMESSMRGEVGYKEAPDSVVNSLKRLAYGIVEDEPLESIVCYVPEIDGYTQIPFTKDFSGRVIADPFDLLPKRYRNHIMRENKKAKELIGRRVIQLIENQREYHKRNG
jgi:hypothetical protein